MSLVTLWWHSDSLSDPSKSSVRNWPNGQKLRSILSADLSSVHVLLVQYIRVNHRQMGQISACACSTETPLPVSVRDVLFPISDDKPGERRNTCVITLTSSSERELAHNVIKWDTTVCRRNSISADHHIHAPLDSPTTGSIHSLPRQYYIR